MYIVHVYIHHVAYTYFKIKVQNAVIPANNHWPGRIYTWYMYVLALTY